MMLARACCSGADSWTGAGKLIGAVVSGTLEADVLRIATTWSRFEQVRLELEFFEWIARNQSQSVPRPIKLAWMTVDTGERLDRLCDRFQPADVLLGGPVTEYARLASTGNLAPLDGEESRFWGTARRSVIALAGGRPEPPSGLAFDDPRTDPQTLAWATGQLSKSGWSEGYAKLVSFFGHASHKPGWRSGSALAAYGRGEAEATLRAIVLDDASKADDTDPTSVSWDEGVATCRKSLHPDLARTFLRFLAETREVRPGADTIGRDADASGLMADLLGSTLVDAQDELVSAWTTLDRQGTNAPSSARAWLTESPPWPPASVERLQKRGGEDALTMVEDLAGQIAPDPAVRLALLQSWLRPRRLIDDALIAELSSAAAGRLVREPRFRSWLRAEWTAWASQRYRRVARLASAAGSVSDAGPSRSTLP
jgi:hypothetical protein